MKVKSIPSRWLSEEGRRFDCGPYMSGAREAKEVLARLAMRKDKLQELTAGGKAGIVNAGRIKRLWVEDPAYGVPFLSSSDILQADLSSLPLISRRVVAENPQLLIEPGWTLITRSGTIGRMVYTRPDMGGMACSEHVMRVLPDADRVPSGYLYAYLSSKFGVPLIVSGTYGSIIQSIEPHHIANLPVPRLGEALEQRVHALIEEAAVNRSTAATLRQQAQKELARTLHLSDMADKLMATHFSTFAVSSSELTRLDAQHFSPVCVEASEELFSAHATRKQLREVARVFTPGIFKRPYVDEPSYGYPYYSGSELFQYGPASRGYLSRKAAGIGNYLVHKDWLLIQDAGQLGGLIGRVVHVGTDIAGGVVSNHLMRVVTAAPSDSAYIFALLSSPHGYRAITRHAFGTSIPQLDPVHIGSVAVPWPSEKDRYQIAMPILEAWSLEDRAIEAEREAVSLVEQAIEEAA